VLEAPRSGYKYVISVDRPIGGPSPVAAQTVLVLFVVALLADRVLGGRTPWRASASDGGTYWLIQAGQVAALTAGLFAPRWVPTVNLPPLVWPVGAVVIVLGTAVRVWSMRSLGRHFRRDVRVQAGQDLVTTGPYRWLRHPSYTGALLLFVGVGIAQANALSVLALTVLPVAVYLRRIVVEEATLAAVLGDRYRTFAAGRARLVPWLY
jgi:protein-S-isoprenylcysteine O-methyltransferase Ste14